MKNQNQFFIGVGKIENLADFLNENSRKSNPVFFSAFSVSQPYQNPPGMNEITQFVRVSTILDGVCYYWQMKLGSYSTFNGEIWGRGDYEKTVERSRKFADELRGFLRDERGIACLEGAQVNIPKDLTPFGGTTDLWNYDPKTEIFVRAAACAGSNEMFPQHINS